MWAKERRSATRGGEGDVEGKLGWTREALWAILAGPWTLRDARSSVQVGIGRGRLRKVRRVMEEVGLDCSYLEGWWKEICPQVRKPKEVRRRARGQERLYTFLMV